MTKSRNRFTSLFLSRHLGTDFFFSGAEKLASITPPHGSARLVICPGLVQKGQHDWGHAKHIYVLGQLHSQKVYSAIPSAAQRWQL